MKNRFLIVLLFTVLFSLTAGSFISGMEKYAWTTAENGLRVRDNASLKSKKIGLIPYNSKVIIIEEKGEEQTIAGKKGKWTKVKSRQGNGWVFGGFLSGTKETGFKLKAEKLYNAIKEKKSLRSFIPKKGIKLIYHADNRCDGSTDGQIQAIKPGMIDKDLELHLVNDGRGWMEDCAEDKITKFTEKFNLRKEIHEWMSYSYPPSYDESKLFLSFGCDQYHLQINFKKEGEDFFIHEIRYSDEDPG